MASLLEKIRVLVSADLNRVVDRALQSNDAAVFQQHIRELQVLQDRLSEQLAGLRAEVVHLRQHSDEQQELVVTQDQQVNELLQAELQEDALAAQDRLNQARLVAGRLAEQVNRLEQQYTEMVETKAQLDARINVLQQSEPEVNGLVDLARSKSLAATATKSLEDLEGAGDPDVARVVDSIRRRLTAAETQVQQLEQRGLARGETPDALKRKELESQLEARKARLGL